MNLVFDLGGVVVRWDPEPIIASVFEDPEVRDMVRSEIFAHQDWLDLDRGVLEPQLAITRGARRTGMPASKIDQLLQLVPPSLLPIAETIDLIRTVKDAGHRLFVLSNMPLASIEYMEREYSFWDIFDGIVISSRIQMIKPHPEIYQYLLREHRLQAADTIFIDDTDLNLPAAAALGIKTVKFTDAAQCERELRKMGCM